ncbi:PRC-barrel domain-containing protein [Geomonas sp. RF6]|uniref:PRC-barrel domain-containing protein n=1 Tax=Geomonas sp. RF6 TaxID=2897342 RepID=UPI001E5E84E1|nr:PRC-barrel domain-containing protein [Geomonas sp. RF6]UFS70983.1 PRC-barrel domain-containing protein [Geomonas sp. RF6]
MRLRVMLATIFALALASTVPAWAESKGGSSKAGVSSSEMQSSVMKGWSAKEMIMGKDVYNERNEKIGAVEDLILSKDMKASYAIIGVGGFLNMGARKVAVPMHQLKIMEKDKIMFNGATKDALKQMPEFRYHEGGKEHK